MCTSPLRGWQRRPGGKIYFSPSRKRGALELLLPCGRCLGCRFRRSAEWSLRLRCESMMHNENCFITLTYSDRCLPPGSSLSLDHPTLFLKRLRVKLQRQVTIRYFYVGEYSPTEKRPHYHMILFGWEPKDQVYFSGNGNVSEFLTKTWGLGHVLVAPMTEGRADYCAGYVVDKLTGPMAGVYGDRRPPFACMSRRPGLGRAWIEKFRDDVYREGSASVILKGGKHLFPPSYFDVVLSEEDRIKYKHLRLADQVTGEVHPEPSDVERKNYGESLRRRKQDHKDKRRKL